MFSKGGPDNRFITLFYVDVREQSGRLLYLNAGHNPALLVQGGGLMRLSSSSYPLGMFPVAQYLQGEVGMEPGDLLLLYSDGLTEACNDRGEEYGEGRLVKTLLAHTNLDPEPLGRRILEDVERFLERQRPQDDLSIVVLKRVP